MRSKPGTNDKANNGPAPKPAFEAKILRLVRGAKERRAVQRGEVDAIIDPASGHAILLPDAQTALLALKRRFRSLVELSSDGYWEQDEDYRFVMVDGVPISAAADGVHGKTLRELGFDNLSAADWQTHATQLQWRAVFRDLELRYIDSDGTARFISISGEPTFDAGERFLGYRGITRDITQRKQFERLAPRSSLDNPLLLDALALPVCVLDSHGTIITVNRAWQTQGDNDVGLRAGDRYLASYARGSGEPGMDGSIIAAGIAQVVAGERAQFRYEVKRGEHAATRWIMVTATALGQAGAVGVMLTHEDVSAAKYAALWQALESLVARTLAATDEVARALQATLCTIGQAQAWESGQFLALDAAGATLRQVSRWSRTSAKRPPAEANSPTTSPATISRADAGLAGRVCLSGQPLWIRDARCDERTHSALPHECDMRSALAWPVIADDVTLGVLLFASRDTLREPDEQVLRSVRNIGHLLGHYLRRRAADAVVRHDESRFRRLTELGSDWCWETDAQFRFTRTSLAGIAGVTDILGKSLWDLPHLIVSEEEWERFRTELAAQWSFCDFACQARRADGQLVSYLISGEPTYDDHDVFSGFHGVGLDITRRAAACAAIAGDDARSPGPG